MTSSAQDKSPCQSITERLDQMAETVETAMMVGMVTAWILSIATLAVVDGLRALGVGICRWWWSAIARAIYGTK